MPLRDEKKRSYQRDWWHRRRTAWLAANGPCAICGSSYKLEVDHLDPAAKVSHRVWSWSESRRKAELEKCRVLCQKCHAKRHRSCSHGSKRMYKDNGCRCDICWLANLQRRRGERLRRKLREAA